jgi:hypothetical protein
MNRLQGQVGAEPVAVLAARVGGRKEQQKSGFAQLSRANPQPQGGKEHVAAPGFEEFVKGQKQKLEHHLMLVGRRGQHFQEAVGELDQAAAVVGQDEVLFLAPLPLAQWH